MNAFLISPLLLLLTPLVAFGQWGVSVALGNTFTSKKALCFRSPQNSSLDVYPGSISGDYHCPVPAALLTMFGELVPRRCHGIPPS